jgi:hypothetical protein
LNFGFGENGRPVIGPDAKELQPEASRSGCEKAFELFQRVHLEKSDGGTRAHGPAARSDVGVRVARRFVAARLACPPGDEVRHLGPMGGDFRRRRPPLALARLRIGPESVRRDQPIGVDEGCFGWFDVNR